VVAVDDIDIPIGDIATDWQPDTVDVTVTVEVTVGGQVRRKTTAALTDANPYIVADGLLDGVADDTRRWLNDQKRASR
jgi:hypothetical protein